MPFEKKDPKPSKVAEVGELRDLLGSGTVILTAYEGLNVKAISMLRKSLCEAGGGYRVVKNTLLKRAAVDTPAEPLTEGLEGPTAIAYSTEDPVAAAKALQEFVKATKAEVTVKSGLVDGQLVTGAQVEELAKIPPKDQLYAMVVGGLQGPILGLVSTMQQMIAQLVFTLQAVAEKKEAA